MKADFDGVGSGEDAFGGHERAQREGGDDVLVAATALADEGGVVRRAIDDKVGDVGVVVRGTVEEISPRRRGSPAFRRRGHGGAD